MTRVLLDEGVPRLLAGKLRELGVDATAFPNAWKELSDVELLEKTVSQGFDVLLTGDKNMPFQRPLPHGPLRVLVLPRPELADILGDAGAIAQRLPALEPGRYAVLGRDGSLPEQPSKPL